MNRYGLIGFPLSHSFSQKFFEDKFLREKITESVYQNFPLDDIKDINKLIAEFPDLKGLNVTIPHKEKILPYLAEMDEQVRVISACNCISIKDGNLYGYNTDVFGFEKSFTKYLESYHSKALIFGDGGAAKAVAYVLGNLNIEYLFVVRKGGTDQHKILIKDLSDSIINSHTVIINCTPVGMYPHVHESPAINFEVLTAKHFLYDLIYNPEKTLFLIKGEEKGAFTRNGHEMLVLQAEESWRIWTTDRVS